jgi:prepilin-type processing-associated H-X9-DG protein
LKLRDLPDGGAHNIMLVEAWNKGIAWPEPRDLTVDEAIAAIHAGKHVQHNGYFYYDDIVANVAFADGSVHDLPVDTPDETLRALLTIDETNTLFANGLALTFPEPRLRWDRVGSLIMLGVSYLLLLCRPRRRAVAVAAEGPASAAPYVEP